jgi:hypothetical protein
MRKTPVVMGVLSMVFGGLCAFATGIGLLMTPWTQKILGMAERGASAPKAAGQPDLSGVLSRAAQLTAELKVYTYLTGFAMLTLATTLIIVGALLNKRRAHARPATIAWALAALAYLPAQIYIQLKIVMPRSTEITKAVLATASDPAASGFAQMFGDLQGPLTVAMYLLFYTPFPILLLWLIGRPSAKNDLLPAM